jgi:hypothetical protein
MKVQKHALGLVLLLALAVSLAFVAPAQTNQINSPKNKPAQSGNYKLSGPFVHKNLTVFLIHGKDMIKNKTILTLQEAMERKIIIVHETKSVNELAIENVSKTLEVFVQSGDIVKGGQQDRVLAVDLIVPARSGRISIAAFCVESGRWSKRGNEEAGKFTGSSDRIATKELKIAANGSKSQSEVWEKVAEAQDKLSQNVGGIVNSTQSTSSLQLSLENSKVRETSDEYIKKMSQIIDGQSDVIGYAFAINGKVNSADVYASNALFKKLWPKLLKATAVEAVAEMTSETSFPVVSKNQVNAFFADAEKGKASENNVNSRTKMVTRESDKNLFLESVDLKDDSAWVHRSYILK